MTAHSRILAWRIPWPEEPGGLQSMGSQRVGNDWVHTYKIPAYWADFLKKFRVNLKNQKHWDSSLNAFRLAQRNTVLFPCEICCERSIPLEQFVLIIPFICKVCSHSLYSNDKSTKTDVEACGGYTEIAGNLVKGEWAPSTHHVSLELRKFKVRARWVGHPGTRSSVFIRTIECKRLQQKWWKAHSGLTEMGICFPFIWVSGTSRLACLSPSQDRCEAQVSVWFAQTSPQSSFSGCYGGSLIFCVPAQRKGERQKDAQFPFQQVRHAWSHWREPDHAAAV